MTRRAISPRFATSSRVIGRMATEGTGAFSTGMQSNSCIAQILVGSVPAVCPSTRLVALRRRLRSAWQRQNAPAEPRVWYTWLSTWWAWRAADAGFEPCHPGVCHHCESSPLSLTSEQRGNTGTRPARSWLPLRPACCFSLCLRPLDWQAPHRTLTPTHMPRIGTW